MRVLDLDLDFFLEQVSFRRPDGARVDPGRCPPWSSDRVAHFLRDRCGLDRHRLPIGRSIEHHREAFAWWRELIGAGRLRLPFEVVHVDAHADLGVGNDGHRYLMTTLLDRPPADRVYPDPDRVRDGNYLLFAAACRWLSKITYVAHPGRYWKGVLVQDDRTPCHFARCDRNSGALVLKRCDRNALVFEPGFGVTRTPPIALEPAIPFATVHADEFHHRAPFHVVVLSRSPDYTPAAADRLIGVIEAFFQPC